jgi:hypothetical protein
LQAVDLASAGVGGGGAAPRSGGLGVLATPAFDSGVCTLDPCDPYCLGYDEDAGVAPDGSTSSYYFNMTDIFGGAPGGFAKKSDCGSSSSGCNSASPGAAYPRKCNGEDHFSLWDSCLADTHCDTSLNGGKGSCVGNWDTTATSDPRWDEANQRWLPAVCAGADITVSAACEVAGVAGFNVCNRGNADVTAASIGILLDNGNGNFGSSTFEAGTCPNAAPSCSPAVPGGVLGAGKCFRVTNANCPAWNGGGNPVAYVNPQQLIAECGGTATAGSATGPGCNNNWADVKNKGVVCGSGGASYADTSRTFTYNATCPTGNAVHWKALTYDATVPCNPGACNGANYSQVEFYGTLSDGATTTTEAVIPNATTTKTVNCTYGAGVTAPPTCPVDLRTWANGVVTNGASYSTLTLRIRLIPTPNNVAAPTVGTWSVSYDCTPNE